MGYYFKILYLYVCFCAVFHGFVTLMVVILIVLLSRTDAVFCYAYNMNEISSAVCISSSK